MPLFKMRPTRVNFLEIKPLAEHFNSLDQSRTTISTRNLYEILLLERGSVTATIGDVVHSIPSGAVYFLAPGQVSQINEVEESTRGYYLAFDTDYFLLCLKNQVQLCFYPFFQLDQYPILHLTRRQQEKLVALIRKIDFEYKNRDSINDDLLSKLYLNVLLIEIERLYRFGAVSNHGEPSRKRAITSKFKRLVEKSFMTVRKVSEYADALYLSPNYLNDTVRETTGQSASEIIHDRIVLEAKAKLIQTELSVNEIAYQLNYQDASYFCRFFRRHTGVSPQLFRETNHF